MMSKAFVKSLRFGGLAALAVIPWLAVVAPHLGRGGGLAAYALLLTVAYPLAVGPSLAVGARGALLAFALAALAEAQARLFGGGVDQRLLSAMLILALVRSLVLYRRRPARALALELSLAVAGLIFSGLLIGPSAYACALALWAYCLAQSLFFLVTEPASETAEAPRVDPFEQARHRALEVMRSG